MPRDPVTYPVAWPAFRWAEETGAMELTVAECVDGTPPRPQKVTEILCACLATIDGKAATADLVRSLSVGTREWLLQQVAATCRPAEDWHEMCCVACRQPYDITLDLVDLPRAEPVQGFPVVHVETAAQRLCFEVPNGGHEEMLARCPDLSPLAFFSACVLDDEGVQMLSGMTQEQLQAVESALDAATPETTDTITTTCPACGAAQITRIDPLSYAFPRPVGVLRDVHLLSSTYGWAEAAVLTLPTGRRRSYVSMIAEARGVA